MKKIIKIAVFLLLLLSVNAFAQKDTIKLAPKFAIKNLSFGLTAKVPKCYPRISLALSGGGARAIVALGTLKALAENNIPIEYIVGTSMGSILGGLYASGYSVEELDSIITSINWDDFYSAKETHRNELYLDQKITEDIALLSFDLDGLNPVLPTSFNSGQRFQNFLNYYTVNAPIHPYGDFDRLRNKFRAVSTDLTTGNMVVINKGSLSQALRASSSVTFLLEPVEIDSMLLVDGGLVANIPTKAAYNLGSDYIIAVDAASQLRKRNDLDTPLKIADQIVSIPMNLVTEQDLKYADVIISPDLGSKKNDDFSSLDRLIKVGYKETLSKMDTITNDIFQYQLKNSCDTLRYYTNVVSYNSNSEEETRIINSFGGKDTISNGEILIALADEYNTGKYSDIYAELITDETGLKLKVNYLLKPNLHSVIIAGASEDNKEEILKIINPLIDDFYCERNLVGYLIGVQSYYRKIGYPFAEIEKAEFNTVTRVLTIKIDEGKIDAIKVIGNERSKTPLITRELEVSEGEYLTSSKLSQSLKNLRTTGLFNSVDINIKKQNDKNILIINVEDKLTSILRLGIKSDNERFFQPSIDIRNENLFGTGTELGMHFFGGLRNQLFLVEHKANRIFNTYLTYKIKGYFDRKDIFTYKSNFVLSKNTFSRSKIGEYRQSLLGISAGIGMQTGKFGNVIAEFRYERNKITNIDGNTVNPYNIDIAALKISMKIDTQNKYPYPTTGTLFTTFYETSQKLLGADKSYIKYALNYRGYFSLNSSNTLIPKFEIGFADETVPLSQQFSFGGQFSFWGSHEYEFRGRQIVIASLTYRYKLPVKLWFDTYISARYDIGSIWEREEEIKIENLEHAMGVMFSWDTPIGPADFGAGRSFIVDDIKKIIVRGEPIIYFSLGYYF